MFGLVVLLIMFGYLAVAVTATVLAVRSVKRAGGGRRDQWKRGGLVALIFYLIPFWDAIPTWILFVYKCETEAGIVVRKDFSEWMNENKGDLSSLMVDRKRDRYTYSETGSRFLLNGRVILENFNLKPIYLSVSMYQTQLLDIGTGEVLVTKRDFKSGENLYSGTWVGVKFWMSRESCDSGRGGLQSQFASIVKNYAKLSGDEN